MVGVVSVAVVGVEVVLALQRVPRADARPAAGDGQVLQSKLPVASCT